uniref:Uncharacterized protein n=1 Tax=Lepeophtheirus salmonis TaxID=72036 RepID=A0A0K2TUD0_LEPSM
MKNAYAKVYQNDFETLANDQRPLWDLALVALVHCHYIPVQNRHNPSEIFPNCL